MASDLVVDSISAPATVAQGESFDFSYLVRNAGAATARFHYAGIAVDGEVTETNYDAWNPVASLGPGASRTLTNSIDTAGLALGEHTLTIEEDYWFNRVEESNEANNATTVTFTVTAPAQPDLVVESISAPASVAQGQSFEFSYLVKNAGAATARFHYAGITVDGEVTETNYDAWNPVASLGAGASRTLTNSIDTTGLAVGEHTLTIEEDYWFNGVAESNEANNATTITFTVAPPARPDLVVESVSAHGIVVQGESLDFSYLVKNAGAAPARFNYAGITVDGEVTETNYDAWNAVASLGAGASRALTNSIDTADLAVGEHTLTIEADYWFNRVGESDEANNATTITFTVLSGDLVV